MACWVSIQAELCADDNGNLYIGFNGYISV